MQRIYVIGCANKQRYYKVWLLNSKVTHFKSGMWTFSFNRTICGNVLLHSTAHTHVLVLNSRNKEKGL